MRYPLIAAMTLLAACSVRASDDSPGVAGTGGGDAKSYAITGFTGINLAGADDVDVRVGTGFSVRAEGAAKELGDLRIARDGDMLKIDRQGSLGWGKRDKVRVFVTLPRLAAANVSGSGTMAVDRVDGDRFDAAMAGSGSLKLAALAVRDAGFSIAGSGDIAARGTANTLKVDVAGSGALDAGELRASSATVNIAGSGDVRAGVAGPAKVAILGSGDVDLGREADCSVSKMGSGSVKCR